jgi:hypothetical protein
MWADVEACDVAIREPSYPEIVTRTPVAMNAVRITFVASRTPDAGAKRRFNALPFRTTWSGLATSRLAVSVTRADAVDSLAAFCVARTE